jgi:TonB family protein
MRLIGVLLLFLFCEFSFGQSAPSSVGAVSSKDEIKMALLNRTFFLRELWRQDNLHVDAVGRLIGSSDVTTPMLSGVIIDKVEVKHDRLILSGSRLAAHFQDQQISFVRMSEKLHMEVDKGSDGDYSAALNAIFARSIAELSTSLTPYWKTCLVSGWMPTPVKVSDSPVSPASPTEARPLLPRMIGDVRAPTVLFAPEPAFPSQAKVPLGFDAKILVYLQVNTCGNPTRVKILKGAGPEFDERALRAVSSYLFEPAIQNDKPVPVEMNVEVRFQKF